MENINVKKLVEDIKTGEEAYRKCEWKKWCEKRGLGRWWYEKEFFPSDYASHMTALYTLRAFLRGKMHRKNPPPQIRDFNRSMRENLTPDRQISWDMESHNQMIAESVYGRYATDEAA